jgi:hypothetical protein
MFYNSCLLQSCSTIGNDCFACYGAVWCPSTCLSRYLWCVMHICMHDCGLRVTHSGICVAEVLNLPNHCRMGRELTEELLLTRYLCKLHFKIECNFVQDPEQKRFPCWDFDGLWGWGRLGLGWTVGPELLPDEEPLLHYLRVEPVLLSFIFKKRTCFFHFYESRKAWHGAMESCETSVLLLKKSFWTSFGSNIGNINDE